MNREYVPNEKFITFWSNGKKGTFELSNFQNIEGGIQPFDDGLIFCSVEHAFISRKYLPNQRYRFSINGDLGNIEGFKIIFGEKIFEKKQQFWMKKNNIGILAKTASSKIISKKLKLLPDPNFNNSDELWIKILLSKYRKEQFKRLLKNTGNKYLLEFGRRSKYQCENGQSPPFYCGLIQNNILYGENRMGKYLMYIRDII